MNAVQLVDRSKYKAGKYSDSFPLSKDWTLGMVSSQAVLEKSPVVAQLGFTVDQIVANLADATVNLLQPITDKFGKPGVNCGFRPDLAKYGSQTSLHKKGCAFDLQWPGISDEEYYNRAVWIAQNLPHSEVILEYGGNRPWIHVSFWKDAGFSRETTCVIKKPAKYVPGLKKLTNKPGVGGV